MREDDKLLFFVWQMINDGSFVETKRWWIEDRTDEKTEVMITWLLSPMYNILSPGAEVRPMRPVTVICDLWWYHHLGSFDIGGSDDNLSPSSSLSLPHSIEIWNGLLCWCILVGPAFFHDCPLLCFVFDFASATRLSIYDRKFPWRYFVCCSTRVRISAPFCCCCLRLVVL